MNRPQGKVLPVDDRGDTEVAEVLNGIIRHIEVRSHADIAYDTACENQVTHGEGYWRILTEYCDEMSMEQDIVIAAIRNSFSVYLDPVGLLQDSTGRKCEWGFITDKIHKDQFKSKYPSAKQTNWDELGTGDESASWVDGDFVVIAEYFCVKEEKKTLYQFDDGSITEEPVEGLEPVKTRQTTIRKVHWSKMTGLEEIESQEWAGKYIPIVRVPGNEFLVDGKVHVSGLVRNAKDAQRQGNYFESMDTEMVALQPKAPFVGAVGQFETMDAEWGKANTVNYSRLEYDPVNVDGHALPPPQRQPPPMASQAIIEAKLSAWDNLQSTVGQYNPSLGAEAKEKSGVAIKARQQQADVGTYHYVDNLTQGVSYSTELILDLIPKVYDTKRVVRIVGLDGEPDHCTIDPDQDCAVMESKDEAGAVQKIYNPGVGKYDVVPTVGPSYTTKRQEAAEFMATVLNGNKELMAVIGDLYFRMLDVPGADEIADRLKKTVPPNLLEEDDADPSDPAVQRQQLEQAAAALGEREAQLNAAAEQLQETASATEKAEAAANEKLDQVHQEQSTLEAERAGIDAARRELELAKKLADVTIENEALKAEARVKEVAIQAQGELVSQREQELTVGGRLPTDLLVALSEGHDRLAEAVIAMTQAHTAPRRTKLIMDEAGNPVGSETAVFN